MATLQQIRIDNTEKKLMECYQKLETKLRADERKELLELAKFYQYHLKTYKIWK